MKCYYCSLIAGVDRDYKVRDASFDLHSPAPRCALHWRFVCNKCRAPRHFMSTAFCLDEGHFFCSDCAAAARTVDEPFSAWEYYYVYQSPWSGKYCPSLDRLEFEGRHPLRFLNDDELISSPQIPAAGDQLPQASRECQWPADIDEIEVRASWNSNAAAWDENFDDDGDDHRKYCTDEFLFDMIGNVVDTDILDMGCGNGYLCRKLGRSGARVTGVDISEEMIQRAAAYNCPGQTGIAYLTASAIDLSMLRDASFDGIVSNHLLNNVSDYEAAIRESYRLLKPSGRMIAVISHPCFSCGPRAWNVLAPDSPRCEEQTAYVVDEYFRSGAHFMAKWKGFSPIPYFHRTLSEYWRAFQVAGFSIEGFAEPMISARGRAELPAWRIRQAERIPNSCIFHLTKRRVEVGLASQGRTP